MVPVYVTVSETPRTTATYLPSTGSTTSTAGPDTNQVDRLLLTLTQLQREKEEEDLSNLFKEKPKFDRVMKMRNTDGRPVKYSTWKPVRMYNGRDNIGTRNFKKLN